jgi:hypothetical protein
VFHGRKLQKVAGGINVAGHSWVEKEQASAASDWPVDNRIISLYIF